MSQNQDKEHWIKRAMYGFLANQVEAGRKISQECEARERRMEGVPGQGQRIIVSLYNEVWFGTEVWDKDGHDILRAYRVWGSVWGVIRR